ncbi:MAG: hypothetical protein C4325_04405 [Blastocatellia bacterium]
MSVKIRFWLPLAFVVSLTVFGAGCSWLDGALGSVTRVVGLQESATVISKSAQIRTSYAVVAADLLEVKRGDQLDILDQVEFEKVLWYRVRAHDDVNTEGWIEAQHVITGDVLEKSRELAAMFQNRPWQAKGQLRAKSNLRLAPDMNPENVLFKLASGSTFEIMDWKFVPRQEVPEVDDSGKAEAQTAKRAKNSEIEVAKLAGEPEKIDDKYDIWYLVKLDPSVSPAPAGWLFGRQVDLQVPSEIAFFQQNNRKFVSWHRLDSDSAEHSGPVGRTSTPGNWVVLSRSNLVKAIDGVEPDFDGILVLAFDKYDQNYYTVWRTTSDIWGKLPLRLEGAGDNKTFIVRLRRVDGVIEDKRFVVYRDKNRLRVTPPEDLARYQDSSRR